MTEQRRPDCDFELVHVELHVDPNRLRDNPRVYEIVEQGEVAKCRCLISAAGWGAVVTTALPLLW